MTAATRARSKLYREQHGEPAAIFEPEDGIGVEAFELDFAPGDDDEDLGYVLLTNGMSDRRMTLDAEIAEAVERGEARARAELVWYVREPDPQLVGTLQWLAALPFLDDVWLGFGHTIPMPEPIVPGSDFTAFLLLTPILARHVRLADKLGKALRPREPVELLAVHLLTTAEYRQKREHGVSSLLERMDAIGYPPIMDPTRASMF